MRRVVLPSKVAKRRSKQPVIQPTSLPLVLFFHEESVVHSAKTAPERTEPERTLILVTETGNEAVVSKSEVATLRTLMPHLATTIASQEIHVTPVTTQTLLLLTSTPKYDKPAPPAISEHQLSSTSHSQHMVKLPSRAPSSAEVSVNAAEVQIDLLLANQTYNHGQLS